MSRALTVWCSVVAIALGFALGRLPSGESPSRLAPAKTSYVGFDPDLIDLGDQRWAETLEVLLHFVNRGPVPVTARSADSSCVPAVIL